MTSAFEGVGEEALARLCAAGDADALAHVASLLDASEAYARGRASELLADAPAPALAATLSAPTTFPSAPWWRALTLFAERTGGLPGHGLGEAEVEALVEAAGTSADPDAVFHALGCIGTAKTSGRAALAAAFVGHRDEEIAVRAATVVAEQRALAATELGRLRAVRGGERLHALLLRVEQADSGAASELAARVRQAGPFAYHALEVLEESGDVDALVPLRRAWRRAWLADHVSARAAATAVVLGDSAALEALRRMTGSLRRTARAVARAELFRVGDASDVESVRAYVRDAARDAPFVASELWRRPDALAVEAIAELLQHADDMIAEAAFDAAAQRSGDAHLRDLLQGLAEQGGARAAWAEQALRGPSTEP